MVIPKNIFQTHEWEYEDLPDFMKIITETWIKMNPGWNYVYMGAKERRAYVESFYPELIKMYDRLGKMFQADMWRYIIVYNNGGCYADMDSICIMSLDKMLNQKYIDQEMVCTKIDIDDNKPRYDRYNNCIETKYVNNSNFMSIKNSNILKTVINKMIAYSNYVDSEKHFRNYLPFSESIMINKAKVLFEMENVCIHSKGLKIKENTLRMINSFVVFP